MASLNKAAPLLVSGLVGLAAVNAQAAVYVWNGTSDGSWNVDANWEGTSGEAVNPVFDNTAVIQIAGTANLDQWVRSNRIVKSLEFKGSNTGATAIGLRANDETVARNLTFASDSGNSTLTVDAAASGNKMIGADLNGSNTLGVVKLVSDLDITHNGSGSLIFAKGIEGASRNITLTGTGLTVFSGINTYTGNTTVDGALTLS
ncbi:hypothetical protein, partial [Pontiella sp.]|uniref:hypothetical protein n=1 Tax=Pontiella sp. TaxID=2837462 RepID=UPI0035638E32